MSLQIIPPKLPSKLETHVINQEIQNDGMFWCNMCIKNASILSVTKNVCGNLCYLGHAWVE